jgi:hypothetical protein
MRGNGPTIIAVLGLGAVINKNDFWIVCLLENSESSNLDTASYFSLFVTGRGESGTTPCSKRHSSAA